MYKVGVGTDTQQKSTLSGQSASPAAAASSGFSGLGHGRVTVGSAAAPVGGLSGLPATPASTPRLPPAGGMHFAVNTLSAFTVHVAGATTSHSASSTVGATSSLSGRVAVGSDGGANSKLSGGPLKVAVKK